MMTLHVASIFLHLMVAHARAEGGCPCENAGAGREVAIDSKTALSMCGDQYDLRTPQERDEFRTDLKACGVPVEDMWRSDDGRYRVPMWPHETLHPRWDRAAEHGVVMARIAVGLVQQREEAAMQQARLFVQNCRAQRSVEACDPAALRFEDDRWAQAAREYAQSTPGDAMSSVCRPPSPTATGPAGIALDGTNTIVVRSDDHCVVRIDASGLPVGAAILGRCGGRGTGPLLDGPSHVAVSPLTGAVYVSDTGNNRVVRVIGADVSDVIGDGSASTAGEGVPARDFPIDAPRQLAIDAWGNLFIASNKVVRVVANVDGDDDADGDDQVLAIYGRGDRAAFPERESLCIAAIALADDGSVFVADTCLGFLVRLTRQAPP